jgi:hypothetical protein
MINLDSDRALRSPDADRALRSPDPRHGHVSWLWKHYMFIFGGSQNVMKQDTERSRLFAPTGDLGDLWAFDLISHCWHRVLATGVQPSARSESGQPPLLICCTTDLNLITHSHSPRSRSLHGWPPSPLRQVKKSKATFLPLSSMGLGSKLI